MRAQVQNVTIADNQKWSVNIEMFSGVPGKEVLCAEVKSPGIFDTEDEGWSASTRALNAFEQTGRFPDMSKVW